MIEIQQLIQLLAITECGTISKAAEKLFLSQPALSRSMQKLENELDVEIFVRHKNRVELNENGKLASDYAKKLIDEFNFFSESIRSFDRSHKSISVGGSAPAPIWNLVPTLNSYFPEKAVVSEIRDNDRLIKGLCGGVYSVIVTNVKTDIPDGVTKEFCKEKLVLCVPPEHKLAEKDSVVFADFEGLTMLLYEEIGCWNKIKDLLPDTKFIIQTDKSAFDDLIAETSFAHFATDLSLKQFGLQKNRVALNIDEESAVETFYITALKKNAHLIPELK